MITLRKHQQDILQKAIGKNYALFWDCGTGKTVTGLSLYLENKKIIPNLKLLVVVSPKELIESAWISDCKKMGITSYCDFKKLKTDLPDIVLTNYEYIRVSKNEAKIKDLIKKYPFMCILDESSKIKNHKSSSFKTLQRLQKYFQFRYVMSGTPAPNSETEYWTQISFINPSVYDTSFFRFRRDYFEFTKSYKGKVYKADMEMLRNPAYARACMQQGYKWTLFPEKKTDFFNKMKPYVSRIDQSDVLDLPGETHIERYFELGKEERNAYNTMKKDMVLSTETDIVTTDSILGKMLKLRQITSGFAYDRTDINNPKVVSIGSSKLNCLLDLLEDIGNKQVVIWATFRQEADTIAKAFDKLGKTYTMLNAGVADKQKAINDFADNKVQYVIANPQTAAHGITWTNCCYEVFYSMDYSWERYHQATRRIMRMGQTKPCFYFYILAKDTLDKRILDVIRNKGSLADMAKVLLED